eukprot:gene25883-biopygen6035
MVVPIGSNTKKYAAWIGPRLGGAEVRPRRDPLGGAGRWMGGWVARRAGSGLSGSVCAMASCDSDRRFEPQTPEQAPGSPQGSVAKCRVCEYLPVDPNGIPGRRVPPRDGGGGAVPQRAAQPERPVWGGTAAGARPGPGARHIAETNAPGVRGAVPPPICSSAAANGGERPAHEPCPHHSQTRVYRSVRTRGGRHDGTPGPRGGARAGRTPNLPGPGRGADVTEQPRWEHGTPYRGRGGGGQSGPRVATVLFSRRRVGRLEGACACVWKKADGNSGRAQKCGRVLRNMSQMRPLAAQRRRNGGGEPRCGPAVGVGHSKQHPPLCSSRPISGGAAQRWRVGRGVLRVYVCGGEAIGNLRGSLWRLRPWPRHLQGCAQRPGSTRDRSGVERTPLRGSRAGLKIPFCSGHPLRKWDLAHSPLSAPHQALALIWCCSSFGVEWVGVRGLGRGTTPRGHPYHRAPLSARAAVRIAARRPDFPGGNPRYPAPPVTKCEYCETVKNADVGAPRPSLESWTNLRSNPPPPRARAARRVGADARREARICAPGCAPENPEISDPHPPPRRRPRDRGCP